MRFTIVIVCWCLLWRGVTLEKAPVDPLQDLGACVDPREEEAKWVLADPGVWRFREIVCWGKTQIPCERESMTNILQTPLQHQRCTPASSDRSLMLWWVNLPSKWRSRLVSEAAVFVSKVVHFKERLRSASTACGLSTRRIHISTPWEDMVPIWDDRVIQTPIKCSICHLVNRWFIKIMDRPFETSYLDLRQPRMLCRSCMGCVFMVWTIQIQRKWMDIIWKILLDELCDTLNLWKKVKGVSKLSRIPVVDTWNPANLGGTEPNWAQLMTLFHPKEARDAKQVADAAQQARNHWIEVGWVAVGIWLVMIGVLASWFLKLIVTKILLLLIL